MGLTTEHNYLKPVHNFTAKSEQQLMDLALDAITELAKRHGVSFTREAHAMVMSYAQVLGK